MAAKTTKTATTLAGAVCRVMASVGHVKEDARNTHQGYSYVTDKALTGALQPRMAAEGLALFPTHMVQTTSDHGRTTKGQILWRVDVTVSYELRHADSGEIATIMALGTGTDAGDKAVYKAMTGAYKYALRQAFVIPTGEDAEAHSGQPEQAHTQAPAPAHTQAPTPAPTWDDAPPQTASGGVPDCPACGGPMWDNRVDKTNPRSPDFKCKQKRGDCKHDVGRDGSLSPGKWATAVWAPTDRQAPAQAAQAPEDEPNPPGYEDDHAPPINDEDIPF